MKGKLWLVGMSLIAMALLLVIAVNLLSAPAATATRPSASVPIGQPNPGGGITARAAYELASTWAQTWASDAELLALSTTVERSGASPWTLQLHSPSQRRIAIVLVSSDTVQLLQEQPALYAQTALPLAAWLQDSDAIFDRWWQEQGRTLWPQPDAQTLLLHLAAGETDLTWRIVVLNRQGDLLAHQEISARTGAVISTPGKE